MNTIILLAMHEEAPSFVGKENVFFTGVGKVNAAITASKLIERYKPNLVINFGTAGGITTDHGGIYKCTTFSQRDLILGGCVVGPAAEALLAPIMIGTDGLHVSSGDNFVTDTSNINADLVDMEAFAIASACQHTGVDFMCYKYISDNANEEAKDHFQEHVDKGENYYKQILEQYQIKLISK